MKKNTNEKRDERSNLLSNSKLIQFMSNQVLDNFHTKADDPINETVGVIR